MCVTVCKCVLQIRQWADVFSPLGGQQFKVPVRVPPTKAFPEHTHKHTHTRERVTRPSKSHREAAGLVSSSRHHEISAIIPAMTRRHLVDCWLSALSQQLYDPCWPNKRGPSIHATLRFWRVTNRVEQFAAFPTHSFCCGNPPHYKYLSATYWFWSFGAEHPVLTHSWQCLFREKHDVISSFQNVQLAFVTHWSFKKNMQRS